MVPDTRPLSARKTFWVMVMIIQALVQFTLHYWTIDYGGNDKVISHLGFAGTLVSIALAVVAIVYAYFQTYSQKRDADSVAIQIAQMRELLNALNLSGEQIGTHAAMLKEMQGRLAEINSAQDEVRAIASRIEKGIDEKRALDSSFKQQSPPPKSLDTPDLAKSIVARSPAIVLMSFYALNEVHLRDGTMTEFRKVLNRACVITATEDGNAEKYVDIMSNWIEGIGTGVVYLLAVLNLVRLGEKDPKRGSFKVKVEQNFLDQIPALITAIDGMPGKEAATLNVRRAALDKALDEILPTTKG
jgi:hypothetical protein